jgi:hypothetical protein
MGKTMTAFRRSIYGFSVRLAFYAAVWGLLLSFGYERNCLAQATAVAEDVPEEMLQTQVQIEAHSSVTGRAQVAEDYAQEQQELQVAATQVPPQLDPSIYRTVELLRLRKLLKSLLPFF